MPVVQIEGMERGQKNPRKPDPVSPCFLCEASSGRAERKKNPEGHPGCWDGVTAARPHREPAAAWEENEVFWGLTKL